jgi:hypothetical protein
MNTIAEFPDLSACGENLPAQAAKGASKAIRRKRAKRKAGARPPVGPRKTTAAPLGSQWASVAVLTTIAVAVWTVVLYVERQPLSGGHDAGAEPYADLRVASEPGVREATVETRRQ